MDLKVIKKLINYLKQNDLTEITYRSGKDEITLKQELKVHVPNNITNAQPAANSESNQDEQVNIQDHQLKSPLVGVFYAAKSPNDQPFIKVGDQVTKGDTIGIIEAMKVMNSVKADRTGVVEQIFVQDGEEVEYDEPLIQIK